MHTTPQTVCHASKRVKVCYVEHRALFGLISWQEKVCEHKMGNDLIIETHGKIDRVFIDGKEISLPDVTKE